MDVVSDVVASSMHVSRCPITVYVPKEHHPPISKDNANLPGFERRLRSDEQTVSFFVPSFHPLVLPLPSVSLSLSLSRFVRFLSCHRRTRRSLVSIERISQESRQFRKQIALREVLWTNFQSSISEFRSPAVSHRSGAGIIRRVASMEINKNPDIATSRDFYPSIFIRWIFTRAIQSPRLCTDVGQGPNDGTLGRGKFAFQERHVDVLADFNRICSVRSAACHSSCSSLEFDLLVPLLSPLSLSLSRFRSHRLCPYDRRIFLSSSHFGGR